MTLNSVVTADVHCLCFESEHKVQVPKLDIDNRMTMPYWTLCPGPNLVPRHTRLFSIWRQYSQCVSTRNTGSYNS